MTNQLFFLSLADIFSVYPTIFKELILAREKPKHVFLPSDGDWQEKVYYRLLEVQKKVNEALESGVDFEEVTRRKDKPVFDPLHIVSKLSSPSTTPNGVFRFENRQRCVMVTSTKIPEKSSSFWSLEDIAKAAKLLKKPPLPVQFKNEHEMRKAYSLIYDVFRYKVVLSNALNDISFYDHFPQYIKDKNRILLMLYELFDREFKKRNSEEIDIQSELYRQSEVEDLAEGLWKFRTRLAASMARMRIRYGALNLSQLLPIHLQNEKVAIAALNPIVTGWINPFLLRDKNSTNTFLVDMGFEVQSNNEVKPLTTNQCKWDNICPLFLSCIPDDRSEFTKSKLMTKHHFIMQDRTFSYGPALMSSLLDYFELDGDILQTHISSPRSTAYLASLFYSVNRVNNFYVYGAGTNLKEYRRYMDSLGITNIRIFAESFTSFPTESNRFGTVVGIFANPPNSFSAISDPIDLICSRGGDLSMLEVLTESEISDDGKHRVSLILEEQLLTLQKAMSRPQIQFILYQTHSIVNSENQDMVKYAIELINRLSLEKHKNAFREKRRLEALAEAAEANIPSAAMNAGSPRKEKSKTETPAMAAANKENTPAGEKLVHEDSVDNVMLPEIDEFTFETIPDICINQDACMKAQTAGCFLSLIRRTSITQLNAKYLIQMAETRGLFGKADRSKSSKSKVKGQETNPESAAYGVANGKSKQVRSVVNIDTLISRLMQDTNASFIRSKLDKISTQNKPIVFNFKRRECSRYLMSSLLKLSKSTHNKKFWWHFAFKCIQQTRTPNRLCGLIKFKHDGYTKPKLHYRSYSSRQPFPIHINEIKILCNIRSFK